MILINCSILLMLFLLGLPYWKKAYVLRRWQQSLHLKQHHAVFQTIVNDINGFALSRAARAHHEAMEYTYGEIDFMSFIALIAMTHPTPETLFYDLGSGTGKAVLACAMVFDMQACCGIELFDALHNAALIQQDRLRQYPAYTQKADTIHFMNDNFLNVDLSKASLIFINATALFGDTWEKLNQQLLTQTNAGTVIITTSKPLIASRYIIKTTRVSMSWGIVTAFIHQDPCQDGDSCNFAHP